MKETSSNLIPLILDRDGQPFVAIDMRTAEETAKKR